MQVVTYVSKFRGGQWETPLEKLTHENYYEENALHSNYQHLKSGMALKEKYSLFRLLSLERKQELEDLGIILNISEERTSK